MTEIEEPLLIRALRGQPTPRRPVWLMRQAGRYLPVYQSVRAKVSFLDLCRRPDLSEQVSLEPVERFDVDAAIVFSDILIPLEAMGMEVCFDDRGPLLPKPLTGAKEVAALEAFDPAERTPWILETITRLRDALPADKPVIGFAGAPFTLAAYAVEGRISKSLHRVKALRWREPDTFVKLLDHLATQTVDYFVAQARAGARVLQLFDTWAGELGREDWTDLERPAVEKIFRGVRAHLGTDCPPLVYFSKGTASWLDRLPATGADAFSVDATLPLAVAREGLGGAPIQGNLDAAILHAGPDAVRERTRALLESVQGQDGVSINLGHGVIVGTPPDSVAAFVEEVQKA